MAGENQTEAYNPDPEWIKRLRAKIHRGIDWFVRFAELILLAAGFQFAAIKTGNAGLSLIASVLVMAACFYVAEYLLFISRSWFPPRRGKWWRWTLAIAAMAYLGWAGIRGVQNVNDAITALAQSQDQEGQPKPTAKPTAAPPSSGTANTSIAIVPEKAARAQTLAQPQAR